MNACCDTCVYGRATIDERVECHRHPPWVMVIDDEYTITWPLLPPTDLCGEWHDQEWPTVDFLCIAASCTAVRPRRNIFDRSGVEAR